MSPHTQLLLGGVISSVEGYLRVLQAGTRQNNILKIAEHIHRHKGQ